MGYLRLLSDNIGLIYFLFFNYSLNLIGRINLGKPIL